MTLSKSKSVSTIKEQYSNTRGDESNTDVKFESCIEDKDGNICIFTKEKLGQKTCKYKTVYYKDGSYINNGKKQKGVQYGKSKTFVYNEDTKKYEEDIVYDTEYCWLRYETLDLN